MRLPYLITLVILTFSACKSNNDASIVYHFSSENSCKEQIKYQANTSNLSLLFFDSYGFYPEETYEQSPSAKVKKELRSDSIFQNFAKSTFDFITYDQGCPAGIAKAKALNVRSFPTILLVDKNNDVILKRIGITTANLLQQDIVEKLKEKQL